MLKQRIFPVFCKRLKSKFLASALVLCLILQVLPTQIWAQSITKTGEDTLKIVSLLVEDELYKQKKLKPLILRYARDVSQAQNAQVIITELSKGVSPFEIYEGLAGLYAEGLPGDVTPAELVGVVLVGDLPLPVVEKGGNLWPTVFPYTDFYQPTYLWDEADKRFTYRSGQNMQPEIWHGIINATSTGKIGARVSQLERFFEANHKLHQGETTFGKQVFLADLVRQRKIVPSMLYWRYQEWIEFAEEVQYLRYTKHWLRRLYERAEQGGISSGDLSSLSEDEKQTLADEIVEADGSLTRAEVMESLNADNLTELPDNFAKQIIDNLAKRYVNLYENWLTQANTQVERSGRWEAQDVESLPALVSQKDEASVLKLRYFNDELEVALLEVANTANVPHDVAMPHTVPVTYEEGGPDGGTVTVMKPAYWNGVRPSGTMKAEDCTLIRGANRNSEFPFAQEVEANQSMDIDTVDLCKNAAEPSFNSDKFEGCCARNITYEENAFGYNTCDLGTEWLGGQSGEASLYHKGAELPVFSYRGTREIEGLEGASGCKAGFAINEDPTVAGRFSSLMLHNEPRPEALMEQVSAQFTRALPVDDPRSFSFFDHGETFQKVEFPNIFKQRKAVDNANELEIAIRNILQNKIEEVNTITTAGNTKSNNSFATAGSGFPSGYWPGEASFGEGTECNTSQSVQTIDSFTKKRTWTRDCETSTTTATGGGKGGGGVTTSTENHNHVISRFYETGNTISNKALDDFLKRFDFEELFEALAWIDLNIESKNRQALEKAMSQTQDYNDFFVETDFNGYEVVQIIGDGSTEQGMELAFLPEDFDPDFQFLEARGEEAAFVFESSDASTEFLGEDFADTFLNGEEESKCDSIPNTTLTWPLRLACSLKATTAATTKNVSLGPNIGTNAPLNPIIEDLNVSLSGKRLVVSPSDIFISSQARDLIEVSVRLEDVAGVLQESDFSTEVTLEFDSRDAEDFFSVSPAQALPLVAGEATFYLVPKGKEVGGKFNLQLVARNLNNSDKKLSSKIIPLRLGNYRLWGQPEKNELIVGDTKGTTLQVKVLDTQSAPTRDWEGETLKFTSDGGNFENYGEAEIKNGVAEIKFLPGTKTGVYDINVTDEAGNLPSHKTKITLLPDLAIGIKMTKKSPYLIAGSFYQDIGARLVDQYDNLVDGVPHQWTWETVGLEVQDKPAYDADPRTRGIQMLASFNSLSRLPVRAEAGVGKGKIGVKSDFLATDAARGLSFTVIKDPVFKVQFDNKKIEAGSDDVITATVEARTEEGDLIADDFTLQIGAEPLVQGSLPENVPLKDGRGTFAFQPGTLAGDFKLRLAYPGFKPSLTPFTVLPGAPAKVDLSLPNQDTAAVNFDANKPIELSVKVFDKYRNIVPSWGGKMSLRATEGTAHLIDINTYDLNLLTGKKTIKIYPKNLAGTVRILAESDDLTLGTLEFKLTSFFRLTDVQNLAPQSLLTLLLGWEAGDLRYTQNFATEWLLQNRAGGVATLGVDPEPAYQYGYVAPNGNLGPRLKAEWVSSEHFNALLQGDNKTIAQAKRFAELRLDEQDAAAGLKTPGILWKSLGTKGTDLTLDTEEGLWRYKGLRVIEAGKEGGIKILDRNFKLKSTANLFVWQLYRNRDLLGEITWQFADERLEIKELFTQNGALEVKLIDTSVFTRESLVGTSTNDAYGYVFLDQALKEYGSRKLGSLELSAEDETGTNYLAWGPDWGMAAHLAAGENIGRAMQMGASDILVLYGDPSLRVEGFNATAPKTGFTQDIGQPIFKAAEGSIKSLYSVDVDADGLMDVLSLTGNKLWVNRQQQADANGRLNFGQPEMWLQVPGGVKASVMLKIDNTKSWQLLQLDYKNKLTAWEWKNGQFIPQLVVWPKSVGIESFQSAVLNDDGLTDLVVVDENHTLWRWSWLGENNWAEPEKIYDFPPNFVLTDETLDKPNLNLKFGFITYDGIEGDDVLAGRTTIIKTNPEALARSVEVEDLDEVLLGNYFDATKPNPNQIKLVALEDADFLSRADYTTSSDTLQVKPGSVVEVELKLKTTSTLDRMQLIMPRDTYFSYVDKSLSCSNCGGDLELLPSSQREMFWAKLPRLKNGQTATLRWKLKVESLPDMKVAVGDFENGFDTLDDIAVAWSEGDDPLMLYFMSSKSADENPVVKPVVEENEVVEVTDEAIEKAFDNTADPDGDGVPASHDHYPDTANENKANSLLPAMIAGAIGGITAGLLQGGGSCFHQPMSKAQNAPGLATNYNPPHATPGGKSGGKCATCLKNLRTYPGSTSTGKGFNAVCLGRKSPNMASPAETDNCHVSVPPTQFNETCPETGTKPDTGRMLNNSASFAKGSMNFQIPGDINAASLNSKLQTQSGDIPGRLTAGTDKASAWASEQFVDLNRKTAEAGPKSNRMDASPSFAGKSGPNHLRPEGPLEETQNALQAGDTVNFTREPLPVMIPSTSASELKAAETNFSINKEAFETELESVIPAETENFQTALETLLEAIPEIRTTTLGNLPDEETLREAFTKYETQLRIFASQYKTFCLEKPANQNTNGCKTAQATMLKAQTDFNHLRTLQDEGLTTLIKVQAQAEAALTKINETAPALTPALENYTQSLSSAVEARSEMESFVQKFNESFDNTKDLITTATDRVLQIRELENQVMAATTQMTEVFAKQQQAFEAKEAQKATEWATTSAVNKAQNQAEQGVMNQFYNFSLTFQTDIVDRGTLLPWKTNNGIKGDMPVTKPPVFPHVAQDNKNNTPGRMDVTLPQVQVESVDIGELQAMEETPDMPEVSNDLAADIQALTLPGDPLTQLKSLQEGTLLWEAMAHSLESENLFPTLSDEGDISGAFTALPKAPGDLSVEALTAFAELNIENLPTALATVEVPKLPEFNTVPKLVQPPLDFAANLPKLPINQKPFTPPPPLAQNKIGELLAAAQPAFARMGKIGAYRIGASPVSEWDVKPHVERRTGRTSLDGNRDFTAAALEFKPYAEVAQNLTIKSASGVTDMFKGLGDNWGKFAEGLNESLSFPNNETLPEVKTAIPTEEIKSAGLRPLEYWVVLQRTAWQYRGQIPALEAWEQWVMALNPSQKLGTVAWLKNYQAQWDTYLVKLTNHQKTLTAQNRALVKLAEKDKLGFWQSPQVLALVPEMGRQFTADDTVDLDFSLPERSFNADPVKLDLPDASEFDFDYYNAPGLDLPGNNLADLQSRGIVNNSGDGGFTDKEKEELKNAGLKSGMYYAKNETLGVDLLHKMPFYGQEAQTAADLDGDGENEILYTLRQRTVYIKQSPSLQPIGISNLKIKKWPTADFLATQLPLKSFESTPFQSRLILDIEPFESLDGGFYEWQLRPSVDGAVSVTHGALPRTETEAETVAPMLGTVTKIKGAAEVAHLSRINLPIRTKKECLALPPHQIYFDDVVLRAGNTPARVWTYLHPLRGREAEETQWQIEPGQELRLKYADVCVLEGEASWQQMDEEAFMARKALALGEGLSDGTVLELEPGTEIEVRLSDGQTLNIAGPLTYYWHRIEPGETPDLEQIVPFDKFMTYNGIRIWKDGKPTIGQSLAPHPGILPW